MGKHSKKDIATLRFNLFMTVLAITFITFVLIVAMCANIHTEIEKQGEEIKAIKKAVTISEPKPADEPAEELTALQITATAYCPCKKCCGKTDGITATGTKATAGRTIAVDPSVIPYGTEVIINGNTYVAEDCGGAVNGNDVDIFFDTHEEALNFGRQVLTAYVLN